MADGPEGRERVTGVGGVFFRAHDPEALVAWYVAQLRAAGVPVDDRVEDAEYGRFGWATDPEGNRIELWQPPG